MKSLHNSSSGLTLYLESLAFTLGVLFLCRLAFAFFVLGGQLHLSSDTVHALWVGLRFDARLAAIITAPLGLAYIMHKLTGPVRFKVFFTFYWFVGLCLFTLYVFDWGFYYYLGIRLNATLFELLEDLLASVHMVWQSYPAIRIALGVVVAAWGFAWLLAKLATRPLGASRSLPSKIARLLCGLFVCALCLHGNPSLNMFPLRWSHAYFRSDQALVALGLNPIQNLYDTYALDSGGKYQVDQVRAAYPRMAQYLGVDAPDIKTLNYARHTPRAAHPPRNIIIIIMESLAYPKSSFAPGDEDLTPCVKELAKESLVFHRFFANTRTTARAVFTIMTGIPDVNAQGTASRNPFIADQHILLNAFKEYEKFYMIGGDASWANIRAVLGHNTDNLRIMEEKDWNSPRVDVWGISDHDLFMEAFAALSTQESDKPFVAIIQTAGFHKPYTVPKTPGFQPKELTERQLRHYGFDSQVEYDSLRFSDFALGKFMQQIKKAPCYENTVFFIFGDHGLKDDGQNMPGGYHAANLAPWHVPLLIHAPGQSVQVKTGNTFTPASHVDIFPTAAFLAGIEHENRTLGRNLFDKRFDKSRSVYIGGQKNTPIRLVYGDYCLFDNLVGRYNLYRIDDANASDYCDSKGELFLTLRQLADDLNQTAKYMLHNNKRNR